MEASGATRPLPAVAVAGARRAPGSVCCKEQGGTLPALFVLGLSGFIFQRPHWEDHTFHCDCSVAPHPGSPWPVPHSGCHLLLCGRRPFLPRFPCRSLLQTGGLRGLRWSLREDSWAPRPAVQTAHPPAPPGSWRLEEEGLEEGPLLWTRHLHFLAPVSFRRAPSPASRTRQQHCDPGLQRCLSTDGRPAQDWGAAWVCHVRGVAASGRTWGC